MAIDRKMKRFPVDNDHYKFVVTLSNESCTLGSMEAAKRQFELLRALIDNPQIGYCGPALFQKMKFWHSGEKWVMELEATAMVPPES